MENSVRDFYGLSSMPFSKLLSPQNAFPTVDFKEACAKLAFGKCVSA